MAIATNTFSSWPKVRAAPIVALVVFDGCLSSETYQIWLYFIYLKTVYSRRRLHSCHQMVKFQSLVSHGNRLSVWFPLLRYHSLYLVQQYWSKIYHTIGKQCEIWSPPSTSQEKIPVFTTVRIPNLAKITCFLRFYSLQYEGGLLESAQTLFWIQAAYPLIRTFTAGVLARPQPLPYDVIPATVSVLEINKGPPESPKHASLPPVSVPVQSALADPTNGRSRNSSQYDLQGP